MELEMNKNDAWVFGLKSSLNMNLFKLLEEFKQADTEQI